VLSGFLITYLLLVEKQFSGHVNLWHFYLRRLLRIWPLYYLVILFVLFVYPFLKVHFGQIEVSHLNNFFYLSFLSNFDIIRVSKLYKDQNIAMQGVTWSVSVEEQFYFIWPLIFIFFNARYYIYVFVAFILLSVIFRYLHRNDVLVLYYNTFSVIGDLTIGGLAGYLCFFNASFKKVFQTLTKRKILMVYIAGFLWLIFGPAVLGSNETKIFTRLINCAFFAFVILEQNFSTQSLYKFSKNKFFSFWGKYTYGLYLTHQIAITLVIIFLRKIFNLPESAHFGYTLLKVVMSFTFALGLSYISFEYYEKLFLKLKNKFAFNKLANHP